MKKIVFFLLCFIITSCASVPLSQNNLRYYMQKGEVINQAVESYCEDNSSYPESISTLLGDYLNNNNVKILKENSYESTYYFNFFSSFKYANKIWFYNLNKSKLNENIDYKISLDLSHPRNNFFINVEDPFRHKILFKSNGDYSDYNNINNLEKKGKDNILANYKDWVYIVSCNSRIVNVDCIEPDWEKLIQQYSQNINQW